MSRVIISIEWTLDCLSYLFSRRILVAIADILAEVAYISCLRAVRRYETEIVQAALEIDQPAAGRIALSGFRNLFRFFVDYQQIAIQTDAQVAKMATNTRVDGIEFIQSLFASERPIVLTSIHMGNLLVGLLKLSQEFPGFPPVTIVKYMEERKKEKLAYAKFEKFSGSLTVLRLRKKPAIEAFYQLRRRGVVIILCDVHPSFGPTVPVTLFGKSSNLLSGVAELTIASRGVLLPMVCVESSLGGQKQMYLKIEAPIDSLELSGSGFKSKTQELSQKLVCNVESWIRRYPDQFQNWRVIGGLWN